MVGLTPAYIVVQDGPSVMGPSLTREFSSTLCLVTGSETEMYSRLSQ